MARSLVPFSRNMPAPWRSLETDPFMAMRREMNRLFDDAFGGFDLGLPSLFGPVMGRMPAEMVVPQIDVSETERELQITAELPGIDPKDIEVLLADDRLTIRGETKADHEEEKERNYHIIERSRGAFSRSLRLPFAADPGQVKAAFKDGVLTITIPKPKEVLEKQHRIEVQSDTASSGTGPSVRREQPAGAASSSSTPSAAQTREKETADE
jgi:HSP20 family protein